MILNALLSLRLYENQDVLNKYVSVLVFNENLFQWLIFELAIGKNVLVLGRANCKIQCEHIKSRLLNINHGALLPLQCLSTHN